MISAKYSGPLPDITLPLTAPYWEAASKCELVVQKCLRCKYLLWPPSPVCPNCLGQELVWRPVEPRGTLISFAIYYRAFDKAYASMIPYVVGYIELNAGPRLYGNITGNADHLESGVAVEARFALVAADVRIVQWESRDRELPRDDNQ